MTSPEKMAEYEALRDELVSLFATDKEAAGRRLLDWWFSRPDAERMEFIRTKPFAEIAMAGHGYIINDNAFVEELERRRAAERMEQQKK